MANKVYIVTSGSYSDYSIKRCFLSKEKAKAYMKICADNDLNDLEKYDLDDNIDIMPANYIRIQYYLKRPSYAKSIYNFKICNSNTLDADLSEKYYNSVCYWGDYINIIRPIYSEEYDENYLKEKYLKVCEDLAAQIKSLQELEGWNKDMISDWLYNKQKIVPDSE